MFSRQLEHGDGIVFSVYETDYHIRVSVNKGYIYNATLSVKRPGLPTLAMWAKVAFWRANQLPNLLGGWLDVQ